MSRHLMPSRPGLRCFFLRLPSAEALRFDMSSLRDRFLIDSRPRGLKSARRIKYEGLRR